MNQHYRYHQIPTSRIATFDVFSVGMKEHHVSALLEFDVTLLRQILKEMKAGGMRISLNAWLIAAIGQTLQAHPQAAGYLVKKHRLITFDDINISFMVEKKLGDNRVPIPLVIEKADKKSVETITREIDQAKSQTLSADDRVLHRKSRRYELLYTRLPGFLRRLVWRFMLRNPGIAYRTMGNAGVTSLGMTGQLKGWFIHTSVHPISFGIGSVIKKAMVINDAVAVREILNMTLLINHDVIDGAAMVRFVKDLTNRIEKGPADHPQESKIS